MRPRVSDCAPTSSARHPRCDTASQTASQTPPRSTAEPLDTALARSAGVPIVLDAVARDYRREAFAHTGWLFARWTKGFAADPLRRLRLDRTGGRPPIPVEIAGRRRARGARALVDPDAHRSHRVGRRPRDPHLRARRRRRTSGAMAAVGRGRRRRGRRAGSPTPSTRRCSPPRCARAGRSGGSWSTSCSGRSESSRSPASSGWPCCGSWGCWRCRVPRRLRSASFPSRCSCSSGECCSVSASACCRAGGPASAPGADEPWWADRLTASVAAVADERILAPVSEVLSRHRETRQHLDVAAG